MLSQAPVSAIYTLYIVAAPDAKDVKYGIQIGSDWHQMGQI